MANLIVAGAAGRMGRLLTSLIAQDRTHRLVGAVRHGRARSVSCDGRHPGQTSMGRQVRWPCSSCGKTLVKGTPAVWRQAERRMLCMECSAT